MADSYDEILELSDEKRDEAIFGTIATASPAFYDFLCKINFDFNKRDRKGNTLLHIIAVGGNLAMLKQLSSKISIDLQNDFGQTPLHVAVINEQPEFVKAMLKYKPKIMKDKAKQTPTQYARIRKNAIIESSLLNYEENMDKNDDTSEKKSATVKIQNIKEKSSSSSINDAKGMQKQPNNEQSPAKYDVEATDSENTNIPLKRYNRRASIHPTDDDGVMNLMSSYAYNFSEDILYHPPVTHKENIYDAENVDTSAYKPTELQPFDPNSLLMSSPEKSDAGLETSGSILAFSLQDKVFVQSEPTFDVEDNEKADQSILIDNQQNNDDKKSNNSRKPQKIDESNDYNTNSDTKDKPYSSSETDSAKIVAENNKNEVKSRDLKPSDNSDEHYSSSYTSSDDKPDNSKFDYSADEEKTDDKPENSKFEYSEVYDSTAEINKLSKLITDDDKPDNSKFDYSADANEEESYSYYTKDKTEEKPENSKYDYSADENEKDEKSETKEEKPENSKYDYSADENEKDKKSETKEEKPENSKYDYSAENEESYSYYTSSSDKDKPENSKFDYSADEENKPEVYVDNKNKDMSDYYSADDDDHKSEEERQKDVDKISQVKEEAKKSSSSESEDNKEESRQNPKKSSSSYKEENEKLNIDQKISSSENKPNIDGFLKEEAQSKASSVASVTQKESSSSSSDNENIQEQQNIEENNKPNIDFDVKSSSSSHKENVATPIIQEKESSSSDSSSDDEQKKINSSPQEVKRPPVISAEINQVFEIPTVDKEENTAKKKKRRRTPKSVKTRSLNAEQFEGDENTPKKGRKLKKKARSVTLEPDTPKRNKKKIRRSKSPSPKKVNFVYGDGIFHAIETNNIAYAEEYMSADINHNEYNHLYQTPLIAATIACNRKLVSILAKKETVNVADKSGNSAIFYAIYGQRLPIIHKLVSKGSSVTMENFEGKSPLQFAHEIQCDKDTRDKILFELSIGLFSTPWYFLNFIQDNPDVFNNHQADYLLNAVLKDNIEILVLLIEKNVDINAPVPSLTALHIAIITGSNKSAEILIRSGARLVTIEGINEIEREVNSVHFSRKLFAAILHAYETQSIDFISSPNDFIEFVPPNIVEYPSGYYITAQAISMMQIDCVKRMIELGISVDYVSENGYSLLHYATMKEKLSMADREKMLEIVIFLKERGCSIFATDDFGRLPLHYAIKNGYPEIAAEVCYRRLMFVKDKNGLTPADYCNDIETQKLIDIVMNKFSEDLTIPEESIDLMKELIEKTEVYSSDIVRAVIGRNYIELLRMMLENNLDPDAVDENGKPLLLFAAEVKSIECAKLLILFGASVDCRDKEMNTPLHIAAMNSDMPMCKLLVECGSFARRNAKREKPLDLARRRNSEIRQFLEIHEDLTNYFKHFGEKKCEKLLPGIIAKFPYIILEKLVKESKVDMIRLLVKKYKCDLNVTNPFQTNLLHIAVMSKSDRKMIEYLITHNVDKDAVTQLGFSALHFAAMSKNVDASKILKKHEVNTELRNGKGQTALDIAKEIEFKEFVHLFEEKKERRKSKSRRPTNK